MLYVLHEPPPRRALAAAPPRVRRLLLTSANLSSAAWGRRLGWGLGDARGGALEIRSFELGVCVPPHDEAAARGETLPFDLASRAPCERHVLERAELPESSDLFGRIAQLVEDYGGRNSSEQQTVAVTGVELVRNWDLSAPGTIVVRITFIISLINYHC